MDAKSNAPERRRSSRLGRGSTGPTSSGPTTSSNGTTRLDSNNAAAKAASTSSKPSSSKSGRQGKKKRDASNSTTGGARAQQAASQTSKPSNKRRKSSTDASVKRAVTPSPVATSSASSSSSSLKKKNAPIKGKSIKDALRRECKHDHDAADALPVDRDGSTDTPLPDGVIDLEAMAASHLSLRDVANPHHSLIPYGNDDTNSYLVSYGRQYYAHLFVAAETLRESLVGGEEGTLAPPPTAATAARVTTRSGVVGATTSALPFPRCLSRQTEISSPMRAILVDWLAELTHSFKLQDVTLHLSVKLLDRALCKMVIERKKFQCLGCACMLIASKLEETQPVTTKDLAYMSDSTYKQWQIKEMEVKVCDLLEFRLQTPTSYHFSDRFVNASNATAGLRCGASSPRNPILETMVSYLLELSLLEHGLVETPGGLVAAAALYLARATLGIRDAEGRNWNETLRYYTGYDVDDLENTVLALHTSQQNAEQTNLKCVVQHYKHKDRFEVARRPALLRSDLGFTSSTR